jgi:nucleoid-associated protein YgaU
MQEKIKSFLKSLRLNESTISMFLGALVVVVVGVLVYNYFSSINQDNQLTEDIKDEYAVSLVEENGQMIPNQLPANHTVVAGDHLWKIAESYYHSGYNWTDIAEANNLTNANLIEAGQELTIPRVAVKLATVLDTPENESMVMPGEAQMMPTDSLLTATSHTIVKGDSLWNISVRAYGDGYQWTRVWEANKTAITNPNIIEVGTELTLPR